MDWSSKERQLPTLFQSGSRSDIGSFLGRSRPSLIVNSESVDLTDDAASQEDFDLPTQTPNTATEGRQYSGHIIDDSEDNEAWAFVPRGASPTNLSVKHTPFTASLRRPSWPNSPQRRRPSTSSRRLYETPFEFGENISTSRSFDIDRVLPDFTETGPKIKDEPLEYAPRKAKHGPETSVISKHFRDMETMPSPSDGIPKPARAAPNAVMSSKNCLSNVLRDIPDICSSEPRVTPPRSGEAFSLPLHPGNSKHTQTGTSVGAIPQNHIDTPPSPNEDINTRTSRSRTPEGQALFVSDEHDMNTRQSTPADTVVAANHIFNRTRALPMRVAAPTRPKFADLPTAKIVPRSQAGHSPALAVSLHKAIQALSAVSTTQLNEEGRRLKRNEGSRLGKLKRRAEIDHDWSSKRALSLTNFAQWLAENHSKNPASTTPRIRNQRLVLKDVDRSTVQSQPQSAPQAADSSEKSPPHEIVFDLSGGVLQHQEFDEERIWQYYVEIEFAYPSKKSKGRENIKEEKLGPYDLLGDAAQKAFVHAKKTYCQLYNKYYANDRHSFKLVERTETTREGCLSYFFRYRNIRVIAEVVKRLEYRAPLPPGAMVRARTCFLVQVEKEIYSAKDNTTSKLLSNVQHVCSNRRLANVRARDVFLEHFSEFVREDEDVRMVRLHNVRAWITNYCQEAQEARREFWRSATYVRTEGQAALAKKTDGRIENVAAPGPVSEPVPEPGPEQEPCQSLDARKNVSTIEEQLSLAATQASRDGSDDTSTVASDEMEHADTEMESARSMISEVSNPEPMDIDDESDYGYEEGYEEDGDPDDTLKLTVEVLEKEIEGPKELVTIT